MSDCCYLEITLHGHIETVEALEVIIAALDGECLFPNDDSSDIFAHIAAALNAETASLNNTAASYVTATFCDHDCNYANIERAEAVLQEHGISYAVSHEEGGGYAPGCWSWSPEHGKTTAIRAKGDGPALSVEEVRNAVEGENPLVDIKEMIAMADRAGGDGLPAFTASDAVRVHLGLKPVDPANEHVAVEVAPAAPAKSKEDRAMELLHETLNKWEDEEESVQEEHADHIAELKAFLNR